MLRVLQSVKSFALGSLPSTPGKDIWGKQTCSSAAFAAHTTLHTQNLCKSKPWKQNSSALCGHQRWNLVVRIWRESPQLPFLHLNASLALWSGCTAEPLYRQKALSGWKAMGNQRWQCQCWDKQGNERRCSNIPHESFQLVTPTWERQVHAFAHMQEYPRAVEAGRAELPAHCCVSRRLQHQQRKKMLKHEV